MSLSRSSTMAATVTQMVTMTMTTTMSAMSSATTSAGTNANTKTRPAAYKTVGVLLAVASGCFIGVSYVLKKKGLLQANAKNQSKPGEGVGYLKNAWWWVGMTLMILGELCNFAAYAFVEAIVVTTLGALSVVITAVLSSIFLKERLSFVGKIGCFICVIGAVIIVINSPKESSVADIQEMKHFVIAPGFLSYAGVIILLCAFVALWVGPRYGNKSMIVYLSICSLIGGLSVVATQGLGAAIVAQAGGTPQFNQWFLYLLLVFVVITLLTEIYYLNKALNIYNVALVTPTYYVFFTSSTIVTSAVLFRGFKGTGSSIATVAMGFLEICSGVFLLQLSKSAKDVPDAAVFSGDLDQIKEVANVEEPESEPKADAIRGAAAIVRRISTIRKQAEAREMERLAEDKLRDIQGEDLEDENVVVEWDGLRRRVSFANGTRNGSLSGRRRSNTSASQHPRASKVLSRLEEMEEGRASADVVRVPTEHHDPNDKDTVSESHGILDSAKRKAQHIFLQKSRSHHDLKPTEQVPLDELTLPDSLRKETKGTTSPPRHTINIVPSSPEQNKPSRFGRQKDDEHVRTNSPGKIRSESPNKNTKRQFSFQNMFSRIGTGSHQPIDQDEPMDEDDPRLFEARHMQSSPTTNVVPPTPGFTLNDNGNLRTFNDQSHNSSRSNISPRNLSREDVNRAPLTRMRTEEERLGLVLGDASSAFHEEAVAGYTPPITRNDSPNLHPKDALANRQRAAQRITQSNIQVQTDDVSQGTFLDPMPIPPPPPGGSAEDALRRGTV